jgi:hypothetical protein
MKRSWPIITSIVAFFVISCNTPAGFSDKQKQAIADTVRQVLINYHNDVRKAGLLAEFNYLDSSTEFYWVPPNYASPLSYDSVAHELRAIAGFFRSIHNKWDSLVVTPLTKEYVSYTGIQSTTYTDTLGHTGTHRLIETGMLVRRATGWKLLHGQTAIIPE